MPAVVGLQYWVPHETEVVIPGTCQSLDVGGQTVYTTTKGDVSIPKEKEPEMINDELALRGVNDVCVLKDVSNASLLHTLRVRYGENRIYTNISCILVAANPFKPIPMYSSEYIERYRASHDRSGLDPHIFGIAAEAFVRLVDQQVCQAVLISGESGAGKTENTKFVLTYVASVLRSQAGLQDRLLEINPILEAFGNAKTTRNDNSSRFGKWIEILVNANTFGLSGATVTNYLLEVTRVCSQGPDERNYHVFYQLGTKAAKEAFPMLKITEACDFNYLKRNPATVKNIDDADEFSQLRKALTSLKFSEEEEEHIYRIAGAVLHLGNVEFDADGEGSKLKDDTSITNVAEILMVDKEALRKCVLFMRRVTGKEVFESPLDPAKSRLARDSIAKLMYDRLFNWLVLRCNATLGSELSGEASAKKPLFIGVLDIAGFEFFETNLLEQLFINLSNEKLQQFFNHSVFKKELAEYLAEGIPVSSIDYQDNAEVLVMIEGKGGILSMLDDCTKGVRQTDELYVAKLVKEHEKHKNFLKPKFVKDTPLLFGVRHYAGDVMYTGLGFLVKNVSTQPPEVLELLASSTFPLMQELAKDEAKKGTVGSVFRKSLQNLIDKLSIAEANFVRCIKPNKQKVPDVFTAEIVMDQLKLSGVMETVKIRQAGFLIRPKCLEFTQRYLMLIPKDRKKTILTGAGSKKGSFATEDTDLVKASKEIIEALLESLSWPKERAQEILVGKTKVFVKGDIYRTLEMARRECFIKPTVKIQACTRGWLTRIVMKEVLDVNRALKKCRAQAGDAEHAEVVAFKKNVARATVMENSLSFMDVLLERALKLPIKLPSLPLYVKSRASLAAQTNLARQMQDQSVGLNVTMMQALMARAAGYNMKGELVDKLKARCEEVQKQLSLRRALQNCVFVAVLSDAKSIIAKVTDAGLNSPDKWLLPDGPECLTAATARMAELEEEQKVKALAIAECEKELGGLQVSLEVSLMQAQLVQAMAYDMQGELVDSVKQRCDLLVEQGPYRQELKACLASNKLDEVQKVVGQMKEKGLDCPDKWVLPDGPKLYAQASCWLMEFEQGQRCLERVSSDLERQVQDLTTSYDIPAMQALITRSAAFNGSIKKELVDALKKSCETAEGKAPKNLTPEQAEEHQLESDLLCMDREWQVQNLKSSLEVPVIQALLGTELIGKLKERCEELQKQIPHRKSLRHSAVKEKLEDIEHIMEGVNDAGLDVPEKWLMADGPRLLAMAKKRREQLEEENKVAVSVVADLQTQMEGLTESLDLAVMQGVVGKASAYEIQGGLVDVLNGRIEKLQVQLPLRLELQTTTVSDSYEEMQSIISKAKEAGLDSPDKWLLPDGSEIFVAAVERLKNFDSVKCKIATATAQFDAKELQMAFTEAFELGIPEAEFAESSKLLLDLQDGNFVENKVIELREIDGKDAANLLMVSNLLELVEDPDQFDTCKVMSQLRITGVMESAKPQNGAFLLRLTCADFMRTYSVILPKAQRVNILKAANSKKDGAVTAETDCVKAANTLVEALPEVLTGSDFKASDIAVGKTKVFIKAHLHGLLEEHRRRALQPLAIRVQASWRGMHTRIVTKDILAVGKAFNKCLSEADKLKSMDSASEVQDALAALDAQLDRAVKQEYGEPRPAEVRHHWRVQLPCLPSWVNQRSSLAAKASIARQLEDDKESFDIPSMRALIARAKVFNIEGGLVTLLEKRCDTLMLQLRLRRALNGSVGYEKLEDVQKVIADAKAASLETKENWILLDGADSWSAAARRLEKLEEDKKANDKAIADLEQQMKEMTSSLDVPAMEALLFQAAALSMTGSLVEQITERTTVMKEQKPHRQALLPSLLSDSIEAVVAIVTQVKDAGLDNAEKWLLPDGPKLYARAERWVSQLEYEEKVAESAAADLDNQMKDLLFSFDQTAMASLLSRAERCGAKSEAIDTMKERCDTLGKQLALCSELLSCKVELKDLQALIGKLTAAGLGASAENWLAPDGPRLTSRASQRIKLLQECDDASKTGGDVKEQEILKSLQGCATSSKLEDAQKAVRVATDAGLSCPSKWTAPAGPPAFALASSRLQELEEEQEVVDHAKSDLEWQMANLKASLASPAMQALLSKDFVDLLAGRCDGIGQQLPLRRSLQVSAVYEKLEDVQKVEAEAKAAGLEGSADKWLLADGPRLFATASRRLQFLTDEAKTAEAAVGEIEQKMEELKASDDLPAMRSLIARSEGCNVKQTLVDNLVQRCETIQRQVPLRKELQNCAICEELAYLQKTIATMRDEGLNAPAQWVLPDGPKLFARAMDRQEELKEVEAVKGKIVTAADKMDAKELQIALTTANDLGIPADSFSDQQQLFLALQDGNFVETKTAELQAKGANDPLYLLMVSNLAEQLASLGLKVDSAGMQQVAKDMMKNSTAEGGEDRKSVFVSKNKLQQEVGQKCFEDLANFSKLRDPLTWGSNAKGLAVADEEVDTGADHALHRAAMLEFTDELLSESLTVLEGSAKKVALECFQDLLRCMGDKPNTYQGNKEEPVLNAAKSADVALRDEVFVQIMKQLTKNPSSKSSAAGWELLESVLAEALPSDELSEFLRGFLQKMAASGESAPSKEGRIGKRVTTQAEVEMRGVQSALVRKSFLQNNQPKFAADALETLLARQPAKA